MIQVNRIYLIFKPVHFLVDSSGIYMVLLGVINSGYSEKKKRPELTTIVDSGRYKAGYELKDCNLQRIFP